MLLLDTNVISEMRKLRAGSIHPLVRRWSEAIDLSTLYLSAITIQEIDIGVHTVQRRDPPQATALRRWLEEHILRDFADRILPVDIAVARRSALLHSKNTRPYRDSFIAATAYVHNMPLVTRNVADFLDTGVRIINPWTAT